MSERREPGAGEARQAGILVWGTVAGKLSEAVGPIIVARILGKAEYGTFGALMLVYATVTIVLTAGLPRALLLFFADASRPERRTIFRRLLSLTMLLAFVDAVVLLAVAEVGGPALERVGAAVSGSVHDRSALGALAGLGWLGFYALLDLPTRLWPNLELAGGHARAAALVGLLRSVGMLLATAVPAALGRGVPGILRGLMIFGALHLLVFLIAGGRQMWSGERTESRWTLARMGRYALALGTTEAVNVLNAHLDQLLVLTLFTVEALAEYRNGAWQIPVITTVAYSVGAVQLPRLTGLFQEGRGVEALGAWRAGAAKAARVVVPASLIFVCSSTELMVLAFGEVYAPSGPVFLCYSLLTMARVAAFGSFLLAAGAPERLLKAAICALGFNILISTPLAVSMGVLGPALGTTLAFVPTVLVYCWMMSRVTGARVRQTFPLREFLRVVFAATPGAAATLVISRAMGMGPLAHLMTAVVLIVLIYVIVGRLCGVLSAEDLRFVRQWTSLRVFRNRRAPSPGGWAGVRSTPEEPAR